MLLLSKQYDPEKYSNNNTMKCANTGPWHLGISNEACDNAGGYWYRSPCITLKECIDARPANGAEGYSESFEDFAMPLVIDDAEDEEQCRNTREQLGFDDDHPHDTDVCEAFNTHLCDPFFHGIDELTVDLNEVPEFEPIDYDPIR